MPVPRLMFFSLKNGSRDTLNLLQRFGLANKKFQCSSLNKSRGFSSGRLNGDRLMPERTRDSRSHRSFLIPAAILGIVGAAAILVHYNDERRVVLKGQGINTERNSNKGPQIGGPFTLIDSNHQLFTERNLLGNWVLLYFGYTSSPDIGPAEVQKMATATDLSESKQNLKILPVFVSIDPQRDNPSHLRAYLEEFDSRIAGLTGPVYAVRQMAQEYRVFFKKVEEDGDDYLVESSHNMYLMNPKMEIVRCFGVEYDGKELVDAILEEVNKATT